jgi:hypothetical protein
VSEGADRLTRIEEKLDRIVDDGAKTREKVAELAATLRTHTERQTERTAARDLRCTDHETRIRTVEGYDAEDHETRLVALERMRWLLLGAAVALGVGGAKGWEMLAKLAG